MKPVAILFLFLLGLYQPDQAASRAGFPLVASEIGVHPALLGSGYPGWALQIGLLPNLDVSAWSDRLAISRLSLLTDEQNNLSFVLSELLAGSFPVKGKSSRDVSRVISRKLSNGSDFFTDASLPIFNMLMRREAEKRNYGFSIDFQQRVQAWGHIPGDVFKALFSDSDGLVQGNVLSSKGMAGRFNWTTELHMQFGTASNSGFLSRFKPLGLPAWGLGLTYRLGHVMLDFESSSGKLFIDEDGYLSLSGMGVLTGGGVHLGKGDELDLSLAEPLSGHGHGLSLEYGYLFISEKLLWGFLLKDVGFMFWNGHVATSRISVQEEQLDVWSLSQDDRDIEVETGSIKQKDNIYAEPAHFILPFQYRWDPADKKKSSALSQYMLFGGYMRQYLISMPGHRLVPLLHAGLKNGFFGGLLPLGTAWGLGGAERLYSQVELELRGGRFNLEFRYRAVGTPWFFPKRGLELGVRSYFCF